MTIREVHEPRVARDGVQAPRGRRYAESHHDSAYWGRTLPPDRFARLTQDMHRAIVAHAGSPDADDALLETVIGQAVETFVSRAGHPVAAALQMAPLMRQIGAREAAIGRSFDVLDTSMRIARAAAGAYFPRLLAAHPLSADRAQELRDDLGIFLEQLREHARVGFDRQWSMEEMSADDAGLALRRMLFDPKAVAEPGRLSQLAHRAGRSLPDVVQAMVSLEGPLPPDLLGSADVLAGLRPHEAMLCDGLTPARAAQIAASLGPRAVLVVGTRVALTEGVRALGVARRAATMISTGRLPRPADVLWCEDVLGRIATATDPFLLDTLATKHLTSLEVMSASRRVDMGDLLLEWLETGSPVNEIARRRGQHTQTLHSRMRTLRHLLGERLAQADQRVELVLALRHELPRWRQVLEESSSRRR